MRRCQACDKIIAFCELLSCSVCRITYDYKCLNITTEYFQSHYGNGRYTWECLSCATALQTNIDNMLMRSKGLQANVCNIPDVVYNLPATNSISYEQFRSLFYSKFTKIRSGMYTTGLESPLEKNIIKCNHLLDLTSASLSFLRNELNNRSSSEESGRAPELPVIYCHSTTLEKIVRSPNLEIELIPENENENLLGILQSICKVIKAPFGEHFIFNIRRISKRNRQSQRPRNILVTFPTQRHRDKVISAFKRYNKNNKLDPLNTCHIGLPGDKCNIIISEHLTPECKAIHIATRKIAKVLGFKHVWVRNDSVYVRKYDQSPIIFIKNIADVQKLKYYDLFF
nr:uncharacterized protein LOC113398405 [Vanessa tameamea]